MPPVCGPSRVRVFRSHQAPAPLKQVTEPGFDLDQRVFRSRLAPAPLKQERDADHDAQQDVFRSQEAPAPLKLVIAVVYPAGTARLFQSHSVLALLKHYADQDFQFVAMRFSGVDWLRPH